VLASKHLLQRCAEQAHLAYKFEGVGVSTMDEVRSSKEPVDNVKRPLTAGPDYAEPRLVCGLPEFVILYAALYAAFGALSPFLPAFLHSRQLRPDEIGFLLGAGTAARLIAGPPAGRIADQIRGHRTIFAICSIAAAVFTLSNLGLQTFWPLFAAIILWSASIAPAAPLADALALAAAKPGQAKENFEYGWVRGAGSVAFILGTIGSGQLVKPLGLGVTLVLQAALLVVAAILIGRVPNYLRASGTSPNRTEDGSIFELFRWPAFRQLVLVAALVLGSHALHDSFAVIHWSAAGISPARVSLLWSEQVIAEVVVFLLIGPPLLHKIGPAWALTLSSVVGAIRWGFMAVSTDLYVLAAIEPLHGATFALLHLAAMRVIAGVIPLRLAASAQTVYGTVGAGAAVAILTFASGVLYEHLGGASFWVMAALCAAAIPIAMRVRD
jgi:PPP family 3-phenylpropionic acid transporter